jgi:hypothetical protein
MSFFDKYRTKNMMNKPLPYLENTETPLPRGYPLGDPSGNRGGLLLTTLGTFADTSRSLNSRYGHTTEESKLYPGKVTTEIETHTEINSQPLPKTILASNNECKTVASNYENCLKEHREQIENCESYFHDLKECHAKFPIIKDISP